MTVLPRRRMFCPFRPRCHRICRAPASEPKPVSIDTLDRRILDQLQRDASLTNQALADEIGLSPSACLKRVRRLRERGVIRQIVALLEPEALGACLHIVVEVMMTRDDSRLHRRFERSMLEAPAVRQCYRVTGDSDFVLIVIVRDMAEYDRFCEEVLYRDDNLLKFRTLISRKRAKFDVGTVLTPESRKAGR